MLFHSITKGLLGDVEELRRASPIPTRCLEGFQDELTLNLFQANTPSRKIHSQGAGTDLDRRHGAAGGKPEMFRCDCRPVVEEDRPLDQMGQLPNVPGPRVRQENRFRFRRQAFDWLAVLPREAIQEVTREQRDVGSARPEWRELQRERLDAV